MKKIKVNSRTKELYILVDDSDYELLKNYKWWVTPDGYAWTRDYSNGWRKPKNILLHRYLMKPDNGITVDHIDRNPLNNQRNNLRLATYAEQNLNQKIRVDNTSGHRGVYWESRRNCWRVCINYNKKQIHVGQFKNKAEAIEAYKKKALELYGQFSQ